jgi:hypothetical protein
MLPGESIIYHTQPASAVTTISTMDASWPYVDSIFGPWILTLGILMNEALKTLDFVNSRPRSTIPASTIIALIFYVVHVSIAIAIRTPMAFVAWEELFAIVVMFSAWLCSCHKIRSHVETDIDRATQSRKYSMRVFYRMVAWSLSKPSIGMTFVFATLRLIVRSTIGYFSWTILLLIETGIEATLVTCGILVAMYYIVVADETTTILDESETAGQL